MFGFILQLPLCVCDIQVLLNLTDELIVNTFSVAGEYNPQQCCKKTDPRSYWVLLIFGLFAHVTAGQQASCNDYQVSWSKFCKVRVPSPAGFCHLVAKEKELNINHWCS